MRRTIWAATAAMLLLGGTALAATPAQDCESRKNKEAGKYVECRQKMEAKFALRGDAQALGLGLQKCMEKYVANWAQIERRADGACASTGDGFAIRHYLDTASSDVADALAGGPLTGKGHRLQTGQTQCWGSYSNQPVPCAGTGKDGDVRKGLERLYVDNADGTITDVKTGLMWEKMSDDGSIHDKNNRYSWADAMGYKVAALNAIAFAGYNDWRLPNVNELQSISHYGTGYPSVAPVFHTGCVPGCTVLTCSCGWTAGYSSETFWTSTAVRSFPLAVWAIGSYDASIKFFMRNDMHHARAVRGG